MSAPVEPAALPAREGAPVTPEATRTPIHRVASRWVTSVVCGALCATLVVLLLVVGERLWKGRGLPSKTLQIVGIAGLGGLAFLAPLEACAALGRRFGARWTVLLVVLVPLAAVLFVVAGLSWVEALRAGDPTSFADRLGAALTRVNVNLEFVVSFLVLLAPLGVARALEARPWRVTLAAATSGLVLWVHGYFTTAAADWFDPRWLTFVVCLAAVAAALGLSLGDRLEVRLAARLGRSLPDPEPPAPGAP